MEKLNKKRTAQHNSAMEALNQKYLNHEINQIEYAKRRSALEAKIVKEVS